MSLPLTSIAIHKGRVIAMSDAGEVVSPDTLQDGSVLLALHAPYTAARAGLTVMPQWDVLELFAFLKPAEFCVPTIAGLADSLSLPQPQTADDACLTLQDIAGELLYLATQLSAEEKNTIAELAAPLKDVWPWATALLQAMNTPAKGGSESPRRIFLKTTRDLPEWAEQPAPTPSDFFPIATENTLARLDTALQRRPHAEMRSQQKNYATRAGSVFATPEDQPHLLLAEAGTGTGKTLGYLAPAVEWAEVNEAPVWLSTYTKNLQQQVESETSILYPDETERKRKVVIRKGRDNYLCLHKFEEFAARAPLDNNPKHLVASAILSRWIGVRHDGDLTGTAFPGWLSGLLGYAGTYGLADRHRECSYAACDHYRRCYVEGSRRRAGHARLVVANHALVMTQAAMGYGAAQPPTRIVFDEGHHLFDAADQAFATHFSVREGLELRRWILGNTGSTVPGKQREKGLARRMEGIISEQDEAAQAALDAVMLAASALPAQGAMKRIESATPKGACEEVLSHALTQLRQRSQADTLNNFGGEVALHPLDDPLKHSIPDAIRALTGIRTPMMKLAKALGDKLDTLQDDATDPALSRRIEALMNGLERRGDHLLGAWMTLLEDCANPNAAEEKQAVDWIEVTRGTGGFTNIGLHRHLVDPMQAFAAVMKDTTHGMVITSATLTDSSKQDEEHKWFRAEQRTGIPYFDGGADRLSLPSPFNYKEQAKIIIVDDINRGDAIMTAGAMRDLFIAAGGGAIGLFTAIHRLRIAADRLAAPLADHGINLLAQHVDQMDNGTLIDIFRADETACLLGTDAVRDGVDVPGESLRLMVFDRVPWPRPTILHKRRKSEFGGRDYDEALTRMKLKQAFGRLIRSTSDKGVFVMLDSGLPTRLQDAFPDDVAVERLPLQQAVIAVKDFLS